MRVAVSIAGLLCLLVPHGIESDTELTCIFLKSETLFGSVLLFELVLVEVCLGTYKMIAGYVFTKSWSMSTICCHH